MPDTLLHLERIASEIGALQSKLLLLIGPPGSGKSALLRSLAEKLGAVPLCVGAALGRRLASLPHKQRHLHAGNLLRELADQHALGDLVLIDNIELLFDTTLELNPLDLLKRHAHARRIVAVWPGELSHGRLSYAKLGHPEHGEYSIAGVTSFDIKQEN